MGSRQAGSAQNTVARTADRVKLGPERVATAARAMSSRHLSSTGLSFRTDPPGLRTDLPTGMSIQTKYDLAQGGELLRELLRDACGTA